MRIQLSEHFTYPKLIRFVLPSVIMMIFTSIYGIVDGLFVSNYVGKTAFAAVNLIMPVLMALGGVGFMIGTGGSAIVSKTLGEGDRERANRYFSMLIYVTVGVGIFLSAVGFVFIRPLALLLGAEGEMAEECVLYGRIILLALTAFMLQNVFQSFLVTAEKPKLGLYVTIAAGVTNMVLDFVFVAVLSWGVAGAAAATAMSQLVGGLIPLFYFARKNSSLLRLCRAKPEARPIIKTCTNGSSELVANLSASLVNMLYNLQLIRLCGENGLAAYGVIMYVNFIFAAFFFGYAVGSAPVVGYHYGAGNKAELKNLFGKSLKISGILGVAMTVFGILLAPLLADIFVGYDRELAELTCRGFRIFSLAFLMMGFNIFGSSFFTALNNGLVSALISGLRTFVFQVIVVFLLPYFFGVDGIWFSIVVAELFALVITSVFFVTKSKHYGYMRSDVDIRPSEE